jgi:DNA-binding MarR family transcriptional regulator
MDKSILANNIGFLIHHLYALLSSRSDTLLQENFGIGFSQFKILLVLKWAPSIKQKEIAIKLGQTEASVSRQIKIMYDDGLLQSVPKTDNRREHITTLTKHGIRICDQSVELLSQAEKEILAGLNKKEQDQLRKILKKLFDSDLCIIDKKELNEK